ncbi:partial 1-aminocyclopropane-1-carboxylate deaminase, partial [biofilm metagenome]
SVLTEIHAPFLKDHQINVWLKRDDLLHPIISGNKWRKLKYNLDAALALGKDTLISMGGAYSNHLHALAYVGKCLGLKTIGLIRGERPNPLTPTLQDMASWGMTLRFIPRSEYRLLRDYKNGQDLPGIKDNEYWLPEGGANYLALKGIAEIINEIAIKYDTVCVSCGTGATLAGLIDAIPKHVSALGFAALKAHENKSKFLNDDVKSFLNESLNKECHNWDIFYDYHFGGFAKIDSVLTAFIADFKEKTTIQLEPVYTGKMLYGIYDLIASGYFKPGQCIIALHTGGLQGNRGYSE